MPKRLFLPLLALIAASAAAPTTMTTTPTTPTTSTTTAPTLAPDPTAQVYRQAFAQFDRMSDADQGRIGLCGTDGCWVVTTPLDASTSTMLQQQQETIALIRKATSMPPPDWQIDGDAQKMVEVSNRAAFCSSLLVLVAREELADNKPQLAVDDLLAALTVSRHVAANEPTLLMKMVEGQAWRPAGTELAAVLPALPKDLLAALPARLAALPKSPDTAQIIRGEYAFAQMTAKRQNFTAVALVAGMRDFYKALLDGSNRTPSEFEKLVGEQAKKYENNVMVTIVAPAIKPLRWNVAALEAKYAMLLTAIDILQHGDAALANSKDPGGNGPFTMTKTQSGFILTSAVLSREKNPKPLTLQVGAE